MRYIAFLALGYFIPSIPSKIWLVSGAFIVALILFFAMLIVLKLSASNEDLRSELAKANEQLVYSDQRWRAAARRKPATRRKVASQRRGNA